MKSTKKIEDNIIRMIIDITRNHLIDHTTTDEWRYGLEGIYYAAQEQTNIPIGLLTKRSIKAEINS